MNTFIDSLTCYTLEQFTCIQMWNGNIKWVVKWNIMILDLLSNSEKWKVYHKKLSRKTFFLPFTTFLNSRWELSRPVSPSSGILHLFLIACGVRKAKEAEEKQENLLLSPERFVCISLVVTCCRRRTFKTCSVLHFTLLPFFVWRLIKQNKKLDSAYFLFEVLT